MREKCSHTVTHKYLNLDYFINCIKIERKHNELAEDQCFICQNVYISEKMAKIEVYSTQKVLLGVVYCRNSRNTKSIKGTNHRVLGWLGPFLPILPFSQKYTLFLPRCPPKVSPRSSLPPNFAFFPKVHAFSAQVSTKSTSPPDCQPNLSKKSVKIQKYAQKYVLSQKRVIFAPPNNDQKSLNHLFSQTSPFTIFSQI